MFTVMFQGMLRGFKHIKRIYRNTDIGNAVGRPREGCRHTPEKLTHTHVTARSEMAAKLIHISQNYVKKIAVHASAHESPPSCLHVWI